MSAPGHGSVPLSGSVENTPKISVGDDNEFFHSYDDRDRMNHMQLLNIEASATHDSVEESFYGIPSPEIRIMTNPGHQRQFALCQMANSI
mmetsp:Transcript_33448/g.51370  ORF Transcript_33448/g.51370 Transcript_33448/m.51370 type:complete len:90 (+) Transcript_33448:3696-3965(+)